MSSERCVAVCVVAHNSADDLPGCLASVEGLAYRPLEVVVVDCASEDGSSLVAARHLPQSVPSQLLPLESNRGFAGGMNVAIAATSAPLILSLNPDARPAPDYLDRLSSRLKADPTIKIGALTGRLRRPWSQGSLPRLDACGMRLTLTWRHLDRGSGQVDGGQWSEPERVFGATGAASLFVRRALEDAALDGSPFDPLFHTFREDAELCFRLRERGWEVIYEPSALVEHRRANLPERRRSMPVAVNYHSLKNRYLLRAYHQTAWNFWLTLVPTLGRDAAALAYVLLRERSSLAAYTWLWRNRRNILHRRRLIQRRRLVPAYEINRWFFRSGLPLEPRDASIDSA